MVAPEEVAPGVFLVPIPIAGPLRAVNCYLCRGAGGWTLIDAGFHTAATEQAWREAFAALGLLPRDVERIVVTHFHPDHMGAAGWLQGLTGAPVLILDRELPQVERVWRRPAENGGRELALFTCHGMPAPQLEQLEQYYRRHQARVEPLPQLTPVSEGETVWIGDRACRPIWAPGHAPGLMVLWAEEEGLLFVNDMVLAGITPNVSQRADDARSPLWGFLDSLAAMGRLPARLSLTGHGEPLGDLAGRAAEIQGHHRQRLAEVARLVAGAGGRGTSGWEVSLSLFGPQDSVVNARFALAEAVAHLEYLAEEGRLERRAEGGQLAYAPRG